MLPIGLGIALVAEEFLRVMAGPQWIDAAPVIWALAPVLALSTLNAGVKSVVYITGTPHKIFVRGMVVLAITIPALWLGLAAGGFWAYWSRAP